MKKIVKDDKNGDSHNNEVFQFQIEPIWMQSDGFYHAETQEENSKLMN